MYAAGPMPLTVSLLSRPRYVSAVHILEKSGVSFVEADRLLLLSIFFAFAAWRSVFASWRSVCMTCSVSS